MAYGVIAISGLFMFRIYTFHLIASLTMVPVLSPATSVTSAIASPMSSVT